MQKLEQLVKTYEESFMQKEELIQDIKLVMDEAIKNERAYKASLDQSIKIIDKL